MSNFLKRKSNAGCECPLHKNVMVIGNKKYEYLYKIIRGNWQEENTDILIIMEKEDKELFLNYFLTFTDKFFKDYKYTIINGVGCVPKKLNDSDTSSFYKTCKKHNVKKLIEKFNPKVIITEGKGLYIITENTDLNPLNNHFYVPIKNKCTDYRDFYEDDTWIYSKEFCCKVFPIPPMYTWTAFNNYEKEFVKDQYYRSIEELSKRKKRIPELQFVKVEDENQFLIDLMNNDTIKEIALDTETTGLNFKTDKVFCITLSYDGITGYYLNYNNIDKKILNDFFKSNKEFIWHNYKFDGKMLLEDGIHSRCTFDTMLASHSLNENSPNGLKPLSWLYTCYGGYEDKLQEIIKQSKITDFSKLPKGLLLEYSCTDPIVTFQLYKYFKNRLEQEDKCIKDNFYNYIMPAVDMIIDVERTGIKIDMDYLTEYVNKLKNKIDAIENEIYKIIGKKINLNSNKQLSKVFMSLPDFEILTDDKGYVLKTKNNDLILDKIALNRYAEEKNIDFAKKLVEYNHLTKELSQIGIEEKEQKQTIFNKDDNEENEKGIMASVYEGKLYGGYKLHGTTSGRMAGGGGLNSSINFQNMQKDYDFRKIFIPNTGYILSEWDYSGMEVSIGSQISGPGNLEKLILNGMDMHSYTASKIVEQTNDNELIEIFKSIIDNDTKLTKKYGNKSIKDVISKMKFDYNTIVENKENHPLYKAFRNMSKVQNFRQQYGATVYGISKGLNISENIAKILINSYFETFPEFKRYMDSCVYKASTRGYVKSLLGRKRRIPKLTYDTVKLNLSDKSQIEYFKKICSGLIKKINNLKNVSYNMPIQGTSGQTTVIAMTNIWKEFKEKKMKSKIIANVHDSILFEIHESEINEAYEIIKYQMERPYYKNKEGNKVTLKVDNQIGVWGFGKSLEYYKKYPEEFKKLIGI